jgi:hypothetical protein
MQRAAALRSNPTIETTVVAMRSGADERILT